MLDRPNPINGIAVQGPVSTPGIEDYTTPFPEPMRPGMTLGELARMFNVEERIGARLTVIRMTFSPIVGSSADIAIAAIRLAGIGRGQRDRATGAARPFIVGW